MLQSKVFNNIGILLLHNPRLLVHRCSLSFIAVYGQNGWMRKGPFLNFPPLWRDYEHFYIFHKKISPTTMGEFLQVAPWSPFFGVMSLLESLCRTEKIIYTDFLWFCELYHRKFKKLTNKFGCLHKNNSFYLSDCYKSTINWFEQKWIPF